VGGVRMKPIRVLSTIAALAFSSTVCLAWGRDGHQVIANLTQSRLSPQARKGVAALLDGATLPRSRPMRTTTGTTTRRPRAGTS
jgi:hypothetical protein